MDSKARSRRVIKYVTGFMLATYLLAFLSPARYDFKEPVRLTIYVALYISAFYFGAILGSNRSATKARTYEYTEAENHKRIHFCLIALLVFTTVSMISNMAATGATNLGTALMASLANTDKVYYARAELANSTLMNYITILASPIFTYGSVFGLLYYKKLAIRFKVIYILYIIFEILRWMFVGTNKGLFDIVILFVSVLFLLKEPDPNKKRKSPKQIAIICTLLLFALWFFGYTMQSRLGSRYELLIGMGMTGVNTDHILFRIFPRSTVNLIMRFTDYLVQGYYGLSLGLTLNWQPTFLAGSNVFLRGYMQPLFSINIADRLYQTRIESLYGWDADARWHTMYLWLANDFSFLGVIFVMGIIGYILGESVYDGFEKKNPYSLCLAFLLLKAMFYSSANNQVLGTYSIVTVIAFVILWKKRKKITFRLSRNK